MLYPCLRYRNLLKALKYSGAVRQAASIISAYILWWKCNLLTAVSVSWTAAGPQSNNRLSSCPHSPQCSTVHVLKSTHIRWRLEKVLWGHRDMARASWHTTCTPGQEPNLVRRAWVQSSALSTIMWVRSRGQVSRMVWLATPSPANHSTA